MDSNLLVVNLALQVTSTAVAVGTAYAHGRNMPDVQDPLIWMFAVLMGVMLVVNWRRFNWRSFGYPIGVAGFLGFSALGDTCVLSSSEISFFELGYLFYIGALTSLAGGLWSSSVHDSAMNGQLVDHTEKADKRLTPRVPLDMKAWVGAMLCTAAGIAIVQVVKRDQFISHSVLICVFCVSGLCLWRAVARIGFRNIGFERPNSCCSCRWKRTATSESQPLLPAHSQLQGPVPPDVLRTSIAEYRNVQLLAAMWVILELTSLIARLYAQDYQSHGWARALVLVGTFVARQGIVGTIPTCEPPAVPPAWLNLPSATDKLPVVIYLPDKGYDVTEVAVPWWYLKSAGHDVHFATLSGKMAQYDTMSLHGFWFGRLLQLLGMTRGVVAAEPAVQMMHSDMVHHGRFTHPYRWDNVGVPAVAVVIPGGFHASVSVLLQAQFSNRLSEKMSHVKVVAAFSRGTVVLKDLLEPTHRAAMPYGVTKRTTVRRSTRSADNTDSPLLRNRTVAVLDPRQEQLMNAAYAFCACRCRTAGRRLMKSELTDCTEGVQVTSEGSWFIRDDVLHANSAGVELSDGDCVVLTGRWAGDAFTLSEKLCRALNEVSRGR